MGQWKHVKMNDTALEYLSTWKNGPSFPPFSDKNHGALAAKYLSHGFHVLLYGFGSKNVANWWSKELVHQCSCLQNNVFHRCSYIPISRTMVRPRKAVSPGNSWSQWKWANFTTADLEISFCGMKNTTSHKPVSERNHKKTEPGASSYHTGNQDRLGILSMPRVMPIPYTYTYTYTYTCTYAYTYVYVHIHLHIHIHMYMYIYIYIYIYIYKYIYIYICMYMCIYKYIYVYLHRHMHVNAIRIYV